MSRAANAYGTPTARRVWTATGIGTTLATMTLPTDEPEVLTCPTCSEAHEGTIARIGNRKTACRTCNRFAQTVRRHVARALMEAHPDEAAALRREAEREVYGSLVGSTESGA